VESDQNVDFRAHCTTETISSIVVFCSFTLPCCDEMQSHSAALLPFFRRRALGDCCSAVVQLREGAVVVASVYIHKLPANTVFFGHICLITWQWHSL